jgi:hypothetical protein
VYVTRPPHRDPGDRIALAYDTTAPFPSGTVVYEQNPLTRWRFEFGSPGLTTVSATVEGAVSVRVGHEPVIDLSFSGQCRGTHQGAEDDFAITLSLPRLSAPAVVQVTVHNTNHAPLTGTIIWGDRLLATLAENGPVWQEGCGD